MLKLKNKKIIIILHSEIYFILSYVMYISDTANSLQPEAFWFL